MRRYRLLGLGVVFLVGLAGQSLVGRSEQAAATATSGGGPFDSLHFRSIGPASMSGRISDLAVYEPNPAIFYVGTAHGGVWKTTNHGTTFEAQMSDQGLMSIGVGLRASRYINRIVIDPRDNDVVFVAATG